MSKSQANTAQAALGLTVAAILLVANAWPNLETTVDDAWISARYAMHLAEGHGLVYNAGEPPVEGYTNLLWVLWLALAHVLALPIYGSMTWGGLVVALLGLPAALLLAWRLAGTWHPSLLLAPLLLALSPHYAVAGTNGLESGMFATGVLAATWCALVAERPLARAGAGLSLGALGLIRPEGAGLAALIVLWDLFQRRRRYREPSTWILAGVSGACVVGLLIWRWFTYGDLVPNTFHAKADLGLARVLSLNAHYLAHDGPFWYIVGALTLLAPVLPPRRPERLWVAVLGVAIAVVSLRVHMWMPAGRLLIPILALTTCNLVAAAAGRERWRLALAGLLSAGALALLLSPIHPAVRGYDRRHSVLAHNEAALAAQHLARHAPEGAWLAVRDAGVVAYHVGPGVRVAELHDRALTVPHPDGRPNDLATVPPNPTFVVLTQAREDATTIRYENDRAVFQRLTEPYVYLGRVYQHFHRYYDIYARKDAGIPPLPEALVVNRAGPRPP